MVNGSNLLHALCRRLEGTDIEGRIMTNPVEEDHFRGGTHVLVHDSQVFKKFELDGSTYQVCIE